MSAIKTALIVGAVVVLVTGGAAADYFYQRHQSESEFDGTEYVESIMDRVGGNGGRMGLVVRKSSMIRRALPPAPEGYAKEGWGPDQDAMLYSAAQIRTLDREVEAALSDLDLNVAFDPLSAALLDAYANDTSSVYTNARGVIALMAEDAGKPINDPQLRAYSEQVNRHFTAAENRHLFATYQRVRWNEVKGPVERSSNGAYRTRLRSFEAQLGDVTVKLVTRASTKDIKGFMRHADLNGLRVLGGIDPIAPPAAPAETPKDAPAEGGGFLARFTSGAGVETASVDTGGVPAANRNAKVKINRPAEEQSGCDEGKFCKAEDN